MGLHLKLYISLWFGREKVELDLMGVRLERRCHCLGRVGSDDNSVSELVVKFDRK